MKIRLFLTLLPCLVMAESELSAPYAALDTASLTRVQPFIRDGWQAIALAQGDLNADERPDYALVIQATDQDKVYTTPDSNTGSIDTNPRRLLIVLSDEDEFNPGAHTLTLSDQYWRFIPAAHPEERADPLAYIAINTGILEVKLSAAASGALGGRTDVTYRFKRKDGRFVLSAFSQYKVKRTTGMFQETLVDLDAGHQKTTSGSMSSPRHKVAEDTFKPQQDWTPCMIREPFDFQP